MKGEKPNTGKLEGCMGEKVNVRYYIEDDKGNRTPIGDIDTIDFICDPVDWWWIVDGGRPHNPTQAELEDIFREEIV